MNTGSEAEQKWIKALIDAHSDYRHDLQPEAGLTLDMPTVYRIQQAVNESLGPVAAFKTAPASPGGDYVMAPIQESNVQASGALIDHPGSHRRGVELEIGFRFTADPPDPAQPDVAAALARVVEPCAALEIVESRLHDPEAAGPLWKLTDNGINAGLVLAAPRAAWTAEDLKAPAVRLNVGGNSVWDGPGQLPGGDAFASLLALLHLVGTHCGGLKAGHTVITGSLTGIVYAGAGDRIDGWVDGLGGVSAQFS